MIRPATRSRIYLSCLVVGLFLYIFAFSENRSHFSLKYRDFSEQWGTEQTIMHNDEYCIRYNFLNATDTFREDGLEPVTLAIHGTAEMMKMIEQKPSNWDGPISLGLFVDFHSRQALDYIANLHYCDAEFRRKVTVHFAFRFSAFQDKCPLIKIASKTIECEEFLKNRDKYRKSVVGSFQLYPSNLMRNIARHGAKSDIHFIADVDMIMSENFATKIKPIANEMIDGKNKKLLVVRRFETNSTSIPKNHKELEIAIKNKKNSLWEVQVILHRNDLYNADYFPARIKVMQSLIYSLCRANYTFNLLSHVFDVHEGVKLDDTNYSKSVISHSQKYGKRIAYNRYVKEMNETYPLTYKRCGKFTM